MYIGHATTDTRGHLIGKLRAVELCVYFTIKVLGIGNMLNISLHWSETAIVRRSLSSLFPFLCPSVCLYI